ncbi:F0F1 ATP synthase subunit gamma [bacterium]|nr:F0F1 ATP synthase subunit gamma [bacterium]
MSNTLASMRRQIGGAAELQSVVRTMKAMAAANIGQYEKAERALGDYYRNVELALGKCLRELGPGLALDGAGAARDVPVEAVIFGSDQGLVGRFNDEVADFAIAALGQRAAPARLWAVGERVTGRLSDAGMTAAGVFAVPNSVHAIAPLIGKILTESENRLPGGAVAELLLFYNRPTSGAGYAPVSQRLLPLDARWRAGALAVTWPGRALPEVLGDTFLTLKALIREYLFVSLFRACAESLASENASRLAAMQRADKNIDDLLATLNGGFHRLRQAGIDEELFDVSAGFEALSQDGG